LWHEGSKEFEPCHSYPLITPFQTKNYQKKIAGLGFKAHKKKRYK